MQMLIGSGRSGNAWSLSILCYLTELYNSAVSICQFTYIKEFHPASSLILINYIIHIPHQSSPLQKYRHWIRISSTYFELGNHMRISNPMCFKCDYFEYLHMFNTCAITCQNAFVLDAFHVMYYSFIRPKLAKSWCCQPCCICNARLWNNMYS